jgi:hypothetical protein
MKTLADVQKDLAAGRFEFSRHAFKRAIERNISEQEIRDAGRPRSSRNIRTTSTLRALYCWASPRLDGLCTFRWRLASRM